MEEWRCSRRQEKNETGGGGEEESGGETTIMEGGALGRRRGRRKRGRWRREQACDVTGSGVDDRRVNAPVAWFQPSGKRVDAHLHR